MVTDKIADLIISIKNAGMVRKDMVICDYSKLRYSVAQKLRSNNFVSEVSEQGHGTKKKLVITLSYDKKGNHKIHDVSRISKPGKRVYIGVRSLRPYKNGRGLTIISTPKGILTGEEAKKERVGGEPLFLIW